MEQGTLDEPVLNGENHWTKPPLTYYVIAAGMKVFGENAWGARIGQSFAFVFTVLAVYYLGALLWGSRAAFFCGVAYGLCPFTVGSANALSTDTLLTMWETLTLLCFWLAVRRGGWYYIVLTWAAFGFAFLTKGFPALLCMIAPTISFFYFRRRGEKVPQFFNPLGIAVFLLIGFSWYAVKGWTHPGLMHNWIFKEGIARNVAGQYNRNSQWFKPFTMYFPSLLFGMLPWVFIIAFRWKRIPWPTDMWKRISSWPHSAEWLFVITAFFIPLAVFCLSTSRLPLYVLPLFAPMALTVGKGLEWLVSERHISLKLIKWTSITCMLVMVIAKGAIPYRSDPKDMLVLAQDLKPALEKYSSYDLHILNRDCPYGLQFYLKKSPIDTIEFKDPTDAQGKIRDVVKKAKAGTPQLTIIRTKMLKKLEQLIDGRIYQVIPVNNDWALIVITPPDSSNPTS